MSSKLVGLLPASPTTTRGTATKLSTSKGKIVYANGKAIIVRLSLHTMTLWRLYLHHLPPDLN